MTEYDVVIAGYGPTGAVAANLLGAAGVRTLIVEPKAAVFDIPRAVHFDGEVMRVFQSLGLHEQIARISAPATSLGFTNGRGWDLFKQDITAVPRAHLWDNGNFFNQPALEAHLRDGVGRYSSVTCALGESVLGFTQSASGVQVELASHSGEGENEGEHRTVAAKYLLGCDGAASTVRKLLAIDQEDLQCDEPWLVVDWMLPEDINIEHAAFQICDPMRPATLVPCQGGHIRWEFMVNADDDLANLELEESVRNLIAPHVHRLSPDLTADMGQLVRSKVYNFHALIAETFQLDRVFLLGDAAHQMPPFLGQGMCAGIKDAHNLCWKLIGVLAQQYPAEILASYTSERRPHVAEVIKTAVGHGSVIQNRNHVSAFLRDCYLKLGKLMPFLVSFLRFDLSWQLGAGLFDKQVDMTSEQYSAIGRPLPQRRLTVNSQGEAKVYMSDDLLQPGFTLVSFDVAPEALADVCSEVVALHHLGVGGQATVVDTDGSFAKWFVQNKARVALVRPDRQVYGLCGTDGDIRQQAIRLIERLEHQLQS